YKSVETAANALEGRQTKTTRPELSRGEGFKDLCQCCFIHASDVIRDLQAYKMAGLDIERLRVSEDCFRRYPAIAGGNLDPAVGLRWYGLAGVDHQICQHPLDLAGIAFDEQLLWRQIKLQLDSLGNGNRQKLGAAGHEFREIEGFGDEMALAGIRQQLTREVRSSLRRGNDVLKFFT